MIREQRKVSGTLASREMLIPLIERLTGCIRLKEFVRIAQFVQSTVPLAGLVIGKESGAMSGNT